MADPLHRLGAAEVPEEPGPLGVATGPRRVRALAGVFLAAALAYLGGLALGQPGVCLAAKPIPVLCLAGWVFPQRSRYASRIGVGLVLSAVGDVLLELPGRFLPGLAAFLGAHLAYTAAFLERSRAPRLLRATPFLAYGAAVFAFLAPGLGGLRWPVAGYAAAISVMMWRAAACLTPGARQPALLALSGAISFAASDTLIALDRFHAPIAGARYPIILLYWAGQLAIALSARVTPAAAARAGSGR